MKDARLSGQFYALKNQDKIYIKFDSLIINNKTFPINAVAFDLNSQRGLKADVDDRAGQRLIEGVVNTAGVLINSLVESSIMSSVVNNTTQITMENIETTRILSLEKQEFYLFFDEQSNLEGV